MQTLLLKKMKSLEIHLEEIREERLQERNEQLQFKAELLQLRAELLRLGERLLLVERRQERSQKL